MVYIIVASVVELLFAHINDSVVLVDVPVTGIVLAFLEVIGKRPENLRLFEFLVDVIRLYNLSCAVGFDSMACGPCPASVDVARPRVTTIRVRIRVVAELRVLLANPVLLNFSKEIVHCLFVGFMDSRVVFRYVTVDVPQTVTISAVAAMCEKVG